jgi:hypothetical protein
VAAALKYRYGLDPALYLLKMKEKTGVVQEISGTALPGYKPVV